MNFRLFSRLGRCEPKRLRHRLWRLVGLTAAAAAQPASSAPPAPVVPSLIGSVENRTGRQSDEWGASVAIDGDFAVIGAPGDGNGKAFVYGKQREAGREDSWTLVATLEPEETNISTYGHRVAISGRTVAVATRHVRGGVYIYEQDAATGDWNHRHSFNDNSNDFILGSALAIDGELLVAGNENISQRDVPGEAWVYRRTAGGWEREAVLKGSAYEHDDRFGTAVAVDGGTIAAGAPALWNLDINVAGSIFVFERIDGTWTETDRLRAGDNTQRSLGSSLRLDGNRLASTSRGSHPDTSAGSGAIHVFERQFQPDGGWTAAETIWPSVTGTASEFHQMLAFEDDLLVVNGRTPANFDVEIYALERRANAFGGAVWVPAHPASLADLPPDGVGVAGAVGDFSEGVMLLGLPRWSDNGLPRDLGAFHFVRLLPHPDAPEFVDWPTEPVHLREGTPFSQFIRAEGPHGAAAVSAENLPGWLQLETTGEGGAWLSGTPPAGQTGMIELILAAEDSAGGLRTRRLLQLVITPANSPPVVVEFAASDETVPAGGATQLHWRVLGADTLVLRPSGQVLAAGEGFLRVEPTRSTTYELEATNAHGTVGATFRIDVPIYGEPQRIGPEGATFVDMVLPFDHDEDGDLDLLAFVRPSHFGWFENLDGSFALPEPFHSGLFSRIAESELVPIDADGDGDTDILYPELGRLWLFRSLGAGAGFAAPTAIYTEAQFPSPVVVADFDKDGREDVALVADGGLVWLRQSPRGFDAARGILAKMEVTSIATADFDRDGWTDIVFTRWNGGGNNIHLGWVRNVAGQFSEPRYIESPADDTRLVITGDVDGDGWTDVLTAGFSSRSVAWRRNLGDGSFGQPHQITRQINRPSDLIAADLDGDGDLDVAVASDGDSQVSWFENLGGGTFNRQQILPPGVQRPSSISPADIDGDGDLDLVVTGLIEGLYWYENENDPPAAGDLSVRLLVEDSPPVELDLAGTFVDPQDPHETLVYELVHVSGADLFESAAIGESGRTVALVLKRDAHGVANLRLRATDPSGLSAEADLPVEVIEMVDLALQARKDIDTVGAPGRLLHTITLQNKGPSDATNVRVDLEQVLPQGVIRGEVTATAGQFQGDHWYLDLLAEDATADLEVEIWATGEAEGAVDSIVSVAAVARAGQLKSNPEDDRAGVATSVISPLQVTVGPPPAAPSFARQTGLYTQTVTVRNDNPLPLAGLRLVVDGLPTGVRLANAHGHVGWQPYIDSEVPLEPGAEITLTLEFFVPDRSGSIQPTYQVEAVFVEDPGFPGSVELAPAPDRLITLANGDFMLEFPSTPGRRYAIEYSSDMHQWHRVVPVITAAGNRTQWVDNGPPKTVRHPRQDGARYYRIVALRPRVDIGSPRTAGSSADLDAAEPSGSD